MLPAEPDLKQGESARISLFSFFPVDAMPEKV